MGPPGAPRPRILLLAAALALGCTAGPAAAAGEGQGLPTFLAPIRADVLARLGKATFRCSDSDLGSPGDAFDGRPGTVLRTRAVNPAFLEVTFDAPREVLSAQALFPGGAPHEWALLAGEDPERLRLLFEGRRVPPDAPSPVVELNPPVTARVFRVVAKRLDGDDHVQFGEIYLQARQHPVSIEVVAPSPVVCPSGDLDLGARVTFDGGYRSTSVQGLGFTGPEYEKAGRRPFRLERKGAADPGRTTARFESPGRGSIRARIKGKGSWLESEPLEIEARAEGLPDWSVGWIERTPRLPFDGPHGGLPEAGSSVLYRAHVKNYGTTLAPRVPYRWEVDGKPAGEGFLEPVPRFAADTAEIPLPWDGRRHDVRFVVDPANAFPETSEGNNEVTIQSDALRLGLWVERPLLDWFHRVQPTFKDGADGWEDWAQRQVRRWNRMLADARWPLTPDGVADRVALDLVVEAEDGALPVAGGLPTSDPDSSDRTVDLEWGFPASLLEGGLYRRTGERRDDNPLWFEGSLLHELGEARTLVDLTRLDVRASEVALPAPDASPLAGSAWLPILGADAVHRSASGRMTAGDPAGGYSAHEAFALQRIAGRRAQGGNRNPPPGIGEFLADLPRVCGIRVLAADGKPLDGVKVEAWRRAPGKGGAESFGGDPRRRGETAEGGLLDLSAEGRDPFFEGRRSGSFDPGQGVLLLGLERGGTRTFRFIEIVPFNFAYWGGERERHYEDVETGLVR